MHPPDMWDWEPGQRVILSSTKGPEGYAWVEEPYASPDGEKVAMIASLEDGGGFTALVNGEAWENSFDKAWHLRFSPDGRLTAIVQQDGMWTLAVDGEPWEESFDFLWGTQFSTGGDVIAACLQSGGEYGLVLDGTPWETLFENANQPVLSADGQASAAVVQVASLKPADLDDFAAGVFSVAVNGQAWGTNYMNVWGPAFDPAGKRVAAQVRTTLYDYSIVVDGAKWNGSYGCVWEPRFNPATGSVVAPVRVAGAWGLAQDDQIIWEPKFAQCWQQAFSQDGKNIAAIVAPQFGAFTVAVNAKPWGISMPVVTDLVVGRQGEAVAALGNNDNKDWRLMVNGRFWDGAWDMAWAPVISASGGHVAAVVEKAGKQTVLIDGKPYPREFTKVFEPAFSPDGTKVLIRALDKDAFVRIVAAVA